MSVRHASGKLAGIAAYLRRCFARHSGAEKAEARLRAAIDILPEGIVFLDAEGRYILWNQQYADIYKRSADLFQPGAKLEDTLRIGVARGDYPEALGREEQWIKERVERLYNPSGRIEQALADGRTILIEERRTSDGGVIGLRVDITEMKQREASFRLLFDGNPVPMFVYALDDFRILAVNEAAVKHYGHGRDAMLAMSLSGIHQSAIAVSSMRWPTNPPRTMPDGPGRTARPMAPRSMSRSSSVR